MKLTVKTVQAAISASTPQKLFDGNSLYLHITETGQKWRYSFRLNGKQREYTIGDANLISLAEARKKHRAAYLLVCDGEDPVEKRRMSRRLKILEAERDKARLVTVDQLIEQWYTNSSSSWAIKNSSKIKIRLDKHTPDWFRKTPVVEVTPVHIAKVFNEISKSSEDTACRFESYLRRCFNIAVTHELLTLNPVQHPIAQEAVPKKRKSNNFSHIKQSEEIGKVLNKIDTHSGNPSVSAAIRLLPYVFTRPGELRNMQWSEIEIENRLWRIPAEKMKNGKEHLVPLSQQALGIIVLHYQTPGVRLIENSEFEYVFPGRSGRKPFSDMSMGKAMKSVGISSEDLVPHGWRHTASSALNERLFEIDGEKVRFSADAIEIQLAHSLKGVRGTYNSADYLDERRQMLQAWADWLDQLRKTAFSNPDQINAVND